MKNGILCYRCSGLRTYIEKINQKLIKCKKVFITPYIEANTV
jgi:hypothetical protein